jgi:hypothetical protein
MSRLKDLAMRFQQPRAWRARCNLDVLWAAMVASNCRSYIRNHLPVDSTGGPRERTGDYTSHVTVVQCSGTGSHWCLSI